MDLIGIIVDVLLIVVFILAAKTLYEESVVIDGITAIGIVVLAIIEIISRFMFEEKSKFQYILSILIFMVPIALMLRGGRGVIKRIRTFLDIFFSFGISFVMFCCFIIWNIKPQESIKYLDSEEELPEAYIISLILLVFCSLYLYFGLFKKKICLNFPWWYRILFIIFSILMLVLYKTVSEYIATGEFMKINLEIRAWFLISTILMYVLFPVFLILNRLSTYYKKKQELNEQWLKQELLHISEYKDKQEETKRFRHDIKNHLLSIATMLKENSIEQAKAYLEVLTGEISELSPEVVTGDEMLDCIIASKWATMKQRNIVFSINGVLDKGLHLKPVDICALFSNAIDNAIEALEQVEEGKRIIICHIKKTEQFYYIELENTIVDKVSFFGKKRYTTKKNKNIHGYGIDNMKRTLEKYNGNLEAVCEKDRFLLKMIIPI